jgi:hypothetical protein
MTAAPPLRMQMGEELWIIDSELGLSRHQLREVLRHVTRLAGVRDAPSLERAFHDSFGRAVSVRRAEGAELAYLVTQAPPATHR